MSELKVEDNSGIEEQLKSLNLPSDVMREASEADFLVLPHQWKGEQGFAQETIGFVKYLRGKQGLPKFVLATDPKDIKYLQLHSAEIWIPVLAFIGTQVGLAGLVNLAANWVWDYVTNRNSKVDKIHLDIRIETTGTKISKRLTYDGNVEGLERLKNLKAEDLFGIQDPPQE